MSVLFSYIALALVVTVHCVILQIPNGKLRGSFNGEYYSFTNIPFAKPPVGVNSFEAPQPYTDKWTEILNATVPSVSCVKFSKSVSASNGAEDCLNINVFTPAINPRRPFTVRVFIYGGGFMIGAAQDVAEQYVVRKGIVVVIANYRTGPFGFLSSGTDLVSGNFGLKDQQLSLRWVHDNIHHFGGDPKRVHLTGVSAGGSSAHLHLLNPVSCRYISAAMSSSGTALNPWVIQPNPKAQFRKYIVAIGCDLPDRLDVKRCLQSRSKEEHFAATMALKDVFRDNPFNVFGVVAESRNVRDAFITQHPRDIIRSRCVCGRPWVVAHTEREGSYTAAEFMSYDDNGRELIEILNARWNELAPKVLFYNNSCVKCSEEKATAFRNDYSNFLRRTYMQGQPFSAATYRLLENMFTDVLFVNGTDEAIRLHRKFCPGAVYAYVFKNPADSAIGNILSGRSDLFFGADHGSDMQYVLGLKFLLQPDAESPNDKFIAENLIEMGRYLSIKGVAKYDNRLLPVNNATQTAKLIIHETYYEIETLTDKGVYTKETYYNNV